jgi:hypothetical protein
LLHKIRSIRLFKITRVNQPFFNGYGSLSPIFLTSKV